MLRSPGNPRNSNFCFPENTWYPHDNNQAVSVMRMPRIFYFMRAPSSSQRCLSTGKYLPMFQKKSVPPKWTWQYTSRQDVTSLKTSIFNMRLFWTRHVAHNTFCGQNIQVFGRYRMWPTFPGSDLVGLPREGRSRWGLVKRWSWAVLAVLLCLYLSTYGFLVCRRRGW
jgi:hypothetical protein